MGDPGSAFTERLDALASLGECPAECDEDCGAECHQAHELPARRWHEPGPSCEAARRVVSVRVLAERSRAAQVAEDAGAHDVAELIREPPWGRGQPPGVA